MTSEKNKPIQPDKPFHRRREALKTLAWFDSVEQIPFLNPNQKRFLTEQGLPTVGDLLLRAPLRFVDRRESPPFNQLERMAGQIITAVGEIESVGETGFRGKRRLICYITDGTGHLSGVWFNNYRYYLPKLQPKSRVAFTGKLTFFDGPQITHPQVTFLDHNASKVLGKTGLAAVYPSGEDWERAGFRRHQWPGLINKVLQLWDGLGPYLPDRLVKSEGIPSLPEAVAGLHKPADTEQFDRSLAALKLNELFFHQLLLTSLRLRRRQRIGIPIGTPAEKTRKLIDALPFSLSKSQRMVLDEIKNDLMSGVPMHRLLQGEVGAGKTVVALVASALVADSGFQSAIMAPTDLLARQHYRNALEWSEPAGLRAVLVTASRPPEELKRALYEAANGMADIIIGTHSLFQEKVKIKRLGLVIIDEQHRFGVRQRARLVGKGRHPHTLLMSATPIPRTLALAHYGDLDMSILTPPDGYRRQVVTRILNATRRDEVFGWLRRKLLAGAKGYLIFPLIEEGMGGLEAVEARFEPYSKIDFKGVPTAILHGRQPVEARIQAIESFRDGWVRLLMATPVVEVGVDVPDANLMVIENAERFGLSQIHQLRGRIGRTGQKAACVLLTKEQEGHPGFGRLKILETNTDGFSLAEQDLAMRGSGEPLGERQSGMARFRLADPVADRELLLRAHRAAEWLLEQHPALEPFPDIRRKLRSDYHARPRTLQAG